MGIVLQRQSPAAAKSCSGTSHISHRTSHRIEVTAENAEFADEQEEELPTLAWAQSPPLLGGWKSLLGLEPRHTLYLTAQDGATAMPKLTLQNMHVLQRRACGDEGADGDEVEEAGRKKGQARSGVRRERGRRPGSRQAAMNSCSGGEEKQAARKSSRRGRAGGGKSSGDRRSQGGPFSLPKSKSCRQ